MNANELGKMAAYPLPMGHVPATNVAEWNRAVAGISLRQHYAGLALPAVMAAYIEANGRCIGTDHVAYNCAAHAVRIADALIAELAKRLTP